MVEGVDMYIHSDTGGGIYTHMCNAPMYVMQAEPPTCAAGEACNMCRHVLPCTARKGRT